MKVVDIATEIFSELGEPSDISIPSVAYWVRNNVGVLNNYIYETYYVDSNQDKDYEIKKLDESEEIQEIDILAAAILKRMYSVYRYDVLIRKKFTDIDNDSILSVTDEGSSVTRINRNEVVKALTQIKKEENETLKDLIYAYNSKKSEPRQVAGDDTIVGYYPSSSLVNSNLRQYSI